MNRGLVCCLALLAASQLLIGCSSDFFDSRTGRAKSDLKMILKDPNGAEFQDSKWVTLDGGSSAVYCGAVNSKNSFNAYTGFTRFIVDQLGNVLLEGSKDVFTGQRDHYSERARFGNIGQTYALNFLDAKTSLLKDELAKSKQSQTAALNRRFDFETDELAYKEAFGLTWSKLCERP